MEERPYGKTVHANDADAEERKQSVNTRDWLARTWLDRSDQNRTAKVGVGVEAGSGRLRASFFSLCSSFPFSLSSSIPARCRPVLVSFRPCLSPSLSSSFRSLGRSFVRVSLYRDASLFLSPAHPSLSL